MARGKRGGQAARHRSNRASKRAQRRRDDAQTYREEAGRNGKAAAKRATKSPVQDAGSMGLAHRPGLGSDLVPVREAYRTRTLTEEQRGLTVSALGKSANVTGPRR